MSTYSEKLKDPRWQRKRLEVLERDGWKCRSCGATDKELQIHHTIYENGKKPWEHSSDMLKTLCVECHKLASDAVKIFRAAITEINPLEAYRLSTQISYAVDGMEREARDAIMGMLLSP